MNTTRFLATLAFAGTLIVNTLANILPINGLNTGEVSALYPSLFTPAGLTFSIWTIIYFFLGAFVVTTWRRKNDEVISRILPWFIASCILNITWILVWHNLLPGVSVVIMLALLVVLTVIFRIVQKENYTRLSDRCWIELPFTLYLSWICVATIANISALLVSLNWSGGFLSGDVWTVIMMCVASLLAVKITLEFRVPFFTAVVIWALLGIHIRWGGHAHLPIFYASLMLVTALTVIMLYSIKRNRSV